MNETSCQFGPQHQLAGIITEPAAARPRSALLLISAGLVPKYGPYRLYAQLARRLTTLGVATLRFDLGDIGDSRPAHAGHTLEERTRLEIGAAMQHLAERYGSTPVVVGGLCSGAEDAFRYAETDPRVKGVILIDPFSYATRGWWWRHRLYRLARGAVLALGLFKRSGNAQAPTDVSRLNYKHMDQGRARRILGTLVARGTQIHFIYTGGARPNFNHAGQVAAMFPGIDFRGLVSVDDFPQLEHMQPLQGERDQVVEAIRRRLCAAALTAVEAPNAPPATVLSSTAQSSAM